MGLGPRGQFLGGLGRNLNIEIAAQQLLTPAQDAQLQRGGRTLANNEIAVRAGGGQLLLERSAPGILADASQQGASGTQADQIQRHIGGTAGTVFNALHIDHGHGRFGGNAPRDPMPAAVQHEVADHQNMQVLQGWQLQIGQCGGLRRRSGDGSTGTRASGLMQSSGQSRIVRLQPAPRLPNPARRRAA